jgi:hypothetical protein
MANLGPEALFDGLESDPAGDIKEKLGLGLRYIQNWYKATEDSPDKGIWWAEIDSVREKVELATNSIDASTIFLGKSHIAKLRDAEAAFTSLYQQLTNSIDTVPRPDLITQAASFLESIIDAPIAAAESIVDKTTRGVNNVLGTAFKNLWVPLLIVAVGVGLYFAAKAGLFRAIFKGAK